MIYVAKCEPIVGTMHGTFLQRVFLTLFLAFLASLLILFYKNVIQKGDREINEEWRTTPAATAHP